MEVRPKVRREAWIRAHEQSVTMILGLTDLINRSSQNRLIPFRKVRIQYAISSTRHLSERKSLTETHVMSSFCDSGTIENEYMFFFVYTELRTRPPVASMWRISVQFARRSWSALCRMILHGTVLKS